MRDLLRWSWRPLPSLSAPPYRQRITQTIYVGVRCVNAGMLKSCSADANVAALSRSGGLKDTTIGMLSRRASAIRACAVRVSRLETIPSLDDHERSARNFNGRGGIIFVPYDCRQTRSRSGNYRKGSGGCFGAVSDVIALTHFYEICPSV